MISAVTILVLIFRIYHTYCAHSVLGVYVPSDFAWGIVRDSVVKTNLSI